MNPNDKDQTPSGGSANGGVLNTLFKGVIYFFAILAAIVVKPAQALKNEAYEKSGFSGFAFGAGIILSIIGSIGSGYFGWQHDVAIQWWLGTAIVAPFAIYYYLWPIAFLAVGKWAYKFSNFMWKHVPNVDDSSSHDPKWFSYLLTGLTQAVIVAGGAYLWWTLASHIHTYLDWGWFGWVVGAIGGGVLAWGAGLLVSAGLYNNVGMPLVAVLSGGALTYFYGYDISAHMPSFIQVFATRYASAFRHGGEALQVLVWVGYVFPLGHIIVSRMFSWVPKYYDKLLDKTYNDSDTNYLGFLCQVINLGAAVTAGYHAFAYASTFGYGLWLTAPATAVAALVAYLIGGALLRRWSNMFVGVVSSIGAGIVVFLSAPGLVPFGVIGAVVAGVLAALANGFLIYPVVYQLVKLLTNFVLASWLGKPLVQMYKTISEEVFSAIGKTYDDETAYGPLFVHVINIAVATGVYFLVSELVPMIHLTGLTAIALPVLLTVSSYLFIGRLLVAYKTALIGTIASIGVGAFVGVEVFAHFQHNLWYAVPSFIAGGLAFGFAIFPVSYVVLRAGLETIRASKWARPVVEGVYNFFFGFVQKGWNEFMLVYKRISLSFAPIWASVSKQWDEAWATVKTTWDQAFNGKNKK